MHFVGEHFKCSSAWQNIPHAAVDADSHAKAAAAPEAMHSWQQHQAAQYERSKQLEQFHQIDVASLRSLVNLRENDVKLRLRKFYSELHYLNITMRIQR
jgi:hypothetical protein